MKNICCFLIVLSQMTFLFCQEIENKIDCPQCKVMKIDSIDFFYLIDVQSTEHQYKIVSRKMQNNYSNLLLGGTYDLSLHAIFPSMFNFRDYRHHIGRGICIDIDWGNNLYQARELCGLCYETDSIKLKECKQIINKEEAFENAMLYIYFHYRAKKDKKTSFLNFYEIKKANSIPFVLNNVEQIFIYFFPKISETKYQLFSDTTKEKEFIGKVYYEYKNFYYIKGCFVYGSGDEVMGWIEKKFLSRTKFRE